MTPSHTIPGLRESEIARLAEDIAFAARPGDLIALRGGLGAGKTTLARAIIHALGCDAREEIPSPTFTLVQTYATRRAVGSGRGSNTGPVTTSSRARADTRPATNNRPASANAATVPRASVP
jgi:ATPase subunit of ABC transporter with duplicated ATPase domains